MVHFLDESGASVKMSNHAINTIKRIELYNRGKSVFLLENGVIILEDRRIAKGETVPLQQGVWIVHPDSRVDMLMQLDKQNAEYELKHNAALAAREEAGEEIADAERECPKIRERIVKPKELKRWQEKARKKLDMLLLEENNKRKKLNKEIKKKPGLLKNSTLIRVPNKAQ